MPQANWFPRFRLFLLGVLCVVPSSSLFAQEQPGQFVLTPGVVVDRSANRIFVVEPSDALATVALQSNTGEVLWKNESATRPLSISAGHSLMSLGSVDANRLGVLVLDGDTGKVRAESPLNIPPEAATLAAPLGEGRLDATAVIRGQRGLLRWNYTPPVTKQGLPPGTLSGLPNAELIPEVAQPQPALNDNPGGFVEIDLETGEQSVVDPAAAPNFAPANDAPEQPLLPEIPGPKYLSADGRHVMARERTKGESHRFMMLVFDKQSGEAIGKFPSNVSYVPFYVDEGRIVLQKEEFAEAIDGQLVKQPRQLQALDLNSGEVIWRQPIAEMKFRGPPPP
ncbi:PQQ-binding-like beta-propeller repeat protein [Bremerella sp. JC770]|uniref:outer membrane protein assembly factor BamB family protein n=1 Tax=Bremerella sp. JC770 TaxID=3232137 RepID=UPI00345A2DA4